MKKNEILFNKYYIKNNQLKELYKSLNSKKISANNIYQFKSQELIKNYFGFKKIFITQSCTSALEAAALILDVKYGDEIIVPSFNFVTSAAVFANFGAKIRFVDCNSQTLCASLSSIKKNITKKTKAIIIMHYAGVGSEINQIKKLCKQKNIYLIEDAAQCIGSKYGNKFLGSFGDLSTFSFHETKNISCGEGGMLVVNNQKLLEKAKIVCLKGTNRINFEEKKLNYYTWIDKGFSALASDITCSILIGQLKIYKKINSIRKKLWMNYYNSITKLNYKSFFNLPQKKIFRNSNFHIFYLVFKSKTKRNNFISFMEKNNIRCVFHYLPLHKSPAGKKYAINYNEKLINSEKISECIVRLPLHNHLTKNEQTRVMVNIKKFLLLK